MGQRAELSAKNICRTLTIFKIYLKRTITGIISFQVSATQYRAKGVPV